MFSSHSALYRRAAPALQEHLLAAQSHLRALLTEQASLRRARHQTDATLRSIADVSLGRRPAHVVNPEVYERA